VLSLWKYIEKYRSQLISKVKEILDSGKLEDINNYDIGCYDVTISENDEINVVEIILDTDNNLVKDIYCHCGNEFCIHTFVALWSVNEHIKANLHLENFSWYFGILML